MNVERSIIHSAGMEKDLKRDIFKSLRRGISFLSNSQLKSGGFPMIIWQKNNVKSVTNVKTIFAAPFVLHSLKYVRKFFNIDEISRKAIEFLLNEMEYGGLWRFFGKNTYIHFDVDSTSCVLASLKEYGIDFDYKTIATKLLKYRNSQNIFNTWIPDIDFSLEKVDNNVDWVVNANVLFFYSLLDWKLPEVEQYLIRIVENGMFKERSPYYDSPFCFIYSLTRAYADGKDLRLTPAITKIRGYLLEVINKAQVDPLESALATVSLLNCGINPTTSRFLIKHLLNHQKKDGGWPIGMFFPHPDTDYVYGSEAITTAIALEAISKYVGRYGKL